MTEDSHAGLGAGHPAPARHRANAVELGFALGAGAAAWLVQLLFAFASTSYLCRSGAVSAVPGWLGPALVALDLAALLVAAGAVAAAAALLRRTAHEHRSHVGLLEAGEGRTRFLAIWGVILSAVFVVAILASSFSLLLVPLCRT